MTFIPVAKSTYTEPSEGMSLQSFFMGWTGNVSDYNNILTIILEILFGSWKYTFAVHIMLNRQGDAVHFSTHIRIITRSI